MLMAYLAERLPAQVFVPLAGGLALAGRGFENGISSFINDAGLALLLLAQYRLWDDLADRRQDALTHPDRVLIRAQSILPVVTLCLALAAASLGVALVLDRSESAAMIAGLAAAAGAWYAVRTPRTALDDLVRLAKYPVMVLIVGGSRLLSHPARLFATAAGVYAAGCAYEAWHDPSSFGRSTHER